MVQAHGCAPGEDMIAYFESSPQSHQPGPLAMAAQVFRGSAACWHVTAGADAEVGVGALRDSDFPDQVDRKSIQPW